MKLKVKKLHKDAVIPKYANPGEDAAIDLTCVSYEFKPNINAYQYRTGLAFEIPKGFVGLIFPRSSICKTNLNLANAVGVIDSGFRGEITFMFKSVPPGHDSVMYKAGDRIGQLMLIPYPTIELEEVEELSSSERNIGGYGSSGR